MPGSKRPTASERFAATTRPRSVAVGDIRHILVRRVAIIAAIVGSLLAIASPAADAKGDTRRVLAVGNSYDGTVNFIDARRLRRMGPPLNVIPDGPTPQDPRQAALYNLIISSRGEHNFAQEVDFFPNGKILYVSRGYLGDIAAFSVAGTMLWRLQLPSLRADHLTVSPDGSTIFATSLPGSKVYAISAATHQIVGSYEAGTYPHVLEFSPNGRYLYSGSLGNQLAPYGRTTAFTSSPSPIRERFRWLGPIPSLPGFGRSPSARTVGAWFAALLLQRVRGPQSAKQTGGSHRQSAAAGAGTCLGATGLSKRGRPSRD